MYSSILWVSFCINEIILSELSRTCFLFVCFTCSSLFEILPKQYYMENSFSVLLPTTETSTVNLSDGVFNQAYVLGQWLDFLVFFSCSKDAVKWYDMKLYPRFHLPFARCTLIALSPTSSKLSAAFSPTSSHHAPWLFPLGCLGNSSWSCCLFAWDGSDLLLNKQAFEIHPFVTFWKPEVATGQLLKSRQFPGRKKM